MPRERGPAPDAVCHHAELDGPSRAAARPVDVGDGALRLDQIALSRRDRHEHYVGSGDGNGGSLVAKAGGIDNEHGVPARRPMAVTRPGARCQARIRVGSPSPRGSASPRGATWHSARRPAARHRAPARPRQRRLTSPRPIPPSSRHWSTAPVSYCAYSTRWDAKWSRWPDGIASHHGTSLHCAAFETTPRRSTPPHAPLAASIFAPDQGSKLSTADARRYTQIYRGGSKTVDNALELDTSLAIVEQHPGQALPSA